MVKPVHEIRPLSDTCTLRVRYSETDQMGTFYNARALDWFECGRSELIRNRMKMSYADLESRGVYLPLVEAHLEFTGGARYDDPLEIATTVSLPSRARLRFDAVIKNLATARVIVTGHTIHAFTDRQAKPVRPPDWFIEVMARAERQE